jgi:hypothetical protein
MKTHPWFSETCLIVLTSLFLSGCHSAEEKAKLQREVQNRQDVARVDRELAEDSVRFGAITDWPSLLEADMFTVDIEPIFIRADHRPILFIATLDDERRQNNRTLLYFTTIPTLKEPVSRLILDCADCDLDSLRKSYKDDGEFEVIADVSVATKSLDASEDAPEFVLQGKYLQARFIGDYALNKDAK